MKRFIRIESSAGGGKTSEIVKRFTELIKNKVRFDRILAITFTNKASGEMKRRILKNLKELAFKDRFIFEVVDGKEGIIDNFSDFSVKTIDAFLFSLLKSSALDLGVPPDPEIEENEREKIKEVIDVVLVRGENDNNLKVPIKQFLNFLSENSLSLDPYRNFVDYFFSFFEKAKILGENYELIAGELKDFFFLVKSIFEERKEKEGFILISDISPLVFSYIRKSNVPYLFFKLGEKFYHFLIDEFQDTSLIQWECLKYLIENALSGEDPEGNKGSFFYVGDPKQSIYRWRGTRWELFERVIEDFNGKIDKDDFKCEYIDVNKRSAKEIVKFVNDLFNVRNLEKYFYEIDEGNKKGYLDNFSEVEKIYGRVNQRYDESNKFEGYIEFKLIEGAKSSSEEAIFLYLKEVLDDILRRGGNLGDIAILERINTDCEKVANFLLSNGYPVCTSYDVSLENLPLIRTIIYFFKVLINEKNTHNLLNLVQTEFFSKIFEVEEEKIKAFLLSDKKDLEVLFNLSSNFKEKYRYFKELSKNYSPYYLLLECDYIFKIHERFKTEYLNFLSLLKGISEETENMSLYEFVEKFEKSPYLFSSSSKDAINVLTIHKAKGLEFDVVISLFSSYTKFEIKDKFLIEGQTLENSKIYLKKSLENLKDREVRLYNEVVNVIQELNTLYVCLTRAKREIYFVIGKDRRELRKTYSYFLSKFLNERFGKKEFYTIGKKERFESKSSEEKKLKFERENPFSIEKLKERLFVKSIFESEILSHAGEPLRGEWIHLVLSNIKNLDDLNFEKEIENSYLKAKAMWKRYRFFDENSLERVDYFKAKIKKEFLRELFFTDRKIKTEFEVVNGKGEVFRIDRIIFDDNLKIIEFKTGEKHKEHFDQVRKYLEIAEEIYKKSARGYLVYIDMEEVHEV